MPRLGQNVQNAQICPELPRMPNVPKMPRFAQHAQNCPKCPELPKMPRSAQNAKNYTDWHRIAQILPNLTRCAQNTQNCPEVPKMHRFAQNWYFYISASKTQITSLLNVNHLITCDNNNTITDGGSTAPLFCWYHTEEKTILEHKRDWKDVRGIVERR